MWLLNPESQTNDVQTDIKYLLFLEGFGYLCNETGWADDLNMDRPLYSNHFLHEGDTAHFNEIPVDVMGAASPMIANGVKIVRKFTTNIMEEMVFVP